MVKVVGVVVRSRRRRGGGQGRAKRRVDEGRRGSAGVVQVRRDRCAGVMRDRYLRRWGPREHHGAALRRTLERRRDVRRRRGGERAGYGGRGRRGGDWRRHGDGLRRRRYRLMVGLGFAFDDDGRHRRLRCGHRWRNCEGQLEIRPS